MRLTEAVAQAERPLIWTSADQFGRAVLRGGAELPWTDAAELVHFHAMLGRILGSQVVSLSAGDFFEHLLAHRPAVLAQMRSKTRPGAALRAMLADAEGRTLFREVVAGCAGDDRSRPMVVRVPDPGQWLGWAHARAYGEPPPVIDPERLESAAVLVADFLRALATAGVGAVLLPGGDFGPPAPIVNVAASYGWDIGVDHRTHPAPATSGHADFYLAPDAVAGTLTAVDPGPAFWNAAPKAPSARIYYLPVPASVRAEDAHARIEWLATQPLHPAGHPDPVLAIRDNGS
jgi:hypothetical protein